MSSSESSRSRKPRAAPSLKAQAIGLLSRREHSRQELRAKLLAVIARQDREAAAAAAEQERSLRETPPNGSDDAFRPHDALPRRRDDGGGPEAPGPDAAALDPEQELEGLLDWLEARGYLSDARFVESRIHARAARQGTLRIRHELARHGLALDAAQVAALRESEFSRAKAVWARRFEGPGTDARERARQARFLAARGFAAEVVRRVVGGDDEF